MYSEKVMQIFAHPKNVGIIKNADAVGEVENTLSGDVLKLYLSVDIDTIAEVKFKAFGDPYTIACMSVLTGMLKDQNIDTINTFNSETVLNYLGEIPKEQEYLVGLINDLLADTLKDYNKKLQKLSEFNE